MDLKLLVGQVMTIAIKNCQPGRGDESKGWCNPHIKDRTWLEGRIECLSEMALHYSIDRCGTLRARSADERPERTWRYGQGYVAPLRHQDASVPTVMTEIEFLVDEDGNGRSPRPRCGRILSFGLQHPQLHRKFQFLVQELKSHEHPQNPSPHVISTSGGLG